MKVNLLTSLKELWRRTGALPKRPLKNVRLLSEKSVDAEKRTVGEIKEVLKNQSSENRKSYRLASFSSLYICTR